MKGKTTKRALVTSAVSLLLCVTMLIGTTFAWFTDTASTAVNKIKSGTLLVDIVDAENTGTSLKNGTLSFKDFDGETEILWEPGVTFKTDSFKIKNGGNLALKYKLTLNGISGDSELLKVIEFSVVGEDGQAVDLNTFEGNLTAGSLSGALYIQGTMSTSAGNEYQEKTLDGIGITVVATQDTVEYDSYEYTYDAKAEYPVVATVSEAVEVDSENNTVKKAVELKASATAADGTTPVVTAEVPAGVKLAANTTEVTLSVEETAASEAPATISVEAGEAVKNFEIELKGVDTTANSEKITVNIYVGKGLIDPVVYHNGVKMTSDYSYNAETGILTIETATFSPFTIVYAGTADVWDGTSADTAWYNGTDSSFTISTASQLAGLAQLVNNGNTFAGKTVTLSGNINLNGKEWTPIGNTKNSAFAGTFDGGGKTICDLSVNNTEVAGKVGFFGFITEGSVKNIIFKNADVKTTGYTAGILAAELRGVKVENITTYGEVSSAMYTGGIIGSLVGGSITEDTTITNCVNNANVCTNQTGSSACHTGGIVGYASTRYGNTMIENCTNNGTVTLTGGYGVGTGGIVGFLTGETTNTSYKTATVKNCKNIGSITASTNDSSIAGGIAGCVGWPSSVNDTNSLTATIIGCTNAGTVTATTTNAGGTKVNADICSAKHNVAGQDASGHQIVIQ